MKNWQSGIHLIIGILAIAFVSKTAIAQTGNQSDITGPDPLNQSDITGNNTLEIITQLDGEDSRENTDNENGDSEATQEMNGSREEQEINRIDYELYLQQLQQLDVPRQEELEVNRSAYELYLQQVNVERAVELIEEYQAVEFQKYLDIELFGEVPSVDEICLMLSELWQVTGQKSALVYVSAQFNQLEIVTVLPKCVDWVNTSKQKIASNLMVSSVIEPDLIAQSHLAIRRFQLPGVSREELLDIANGFRQDITDPLSRRTQKYRTKAQQLYQWLIAPMEAQLEAEEIDILVFSMDSGLRNLPIGALHDGEQFLIEKYGVALVPSFGLTDVSYSDVRQSKMLAMGASEFTELNPLPAVPIEMQNILRNPWQGQSFLNQEFTIQKFRQVNQQEKFGMIHLATHGEFETGNINKSYIQFYNHKMNLLELREMANELGWSKTENTPVELLVLSACRTAVGSPEAELGFAGLAIQAGVKSALASLWYVSDAGTLGLMSEFYQRLGENPIKSQALRQTQIAMIKGDIRIENGRLRLSSGEMLSLPPEVFQSKNQDLSHPYFWAAFMMIGNWN